MIKQVLNIVLILFIVGCKTSSIRSNEKKYMNYLLETEDYKQAKYIKNLLKGKNIDSLMASTNDFYKIKAISKPHKKVFSIDELKRFSLKITNYGTKELYLPEWFKISKLDNPEMIIEIYKKKGKTFKKYVQKRLKTETFFHPSVKQNRAVFSSKKGKPILYDNIQIDTFQKIADEGIYNVKIYIDLSNFGYFKILNAEINFEVVK